VKNPPGPTLTDAGVFNMNVSLAGRICSGLMLAGALVPLQASAQIADRRALVAALDSAALAHAEQEMVAGISVAVVRGGDTLLMKGYGSVDLEWGVPTPPDGRASYEIGSMTKQFTAAAVLQLVEEGALDLNADITTYLPDFNTHGRDIPLRRLLDHTSGIKGYTEMPVFADISMKKLPRDSLVTLIEAEPLDFEPGTALIYNNSAYFLLGLIIEKVTGKPYEEYVSERLFQPVGMSSSYYCNERAIREDRAHGYDGSPDGLVRAAYLDHTWPYAAGSLCSTVRDLVRWNLSLHGGELLSPESYQALTTPVPLVDGTPIRYAMGLGVMGEGHHRSIAHGGGINGFLSDGRYYPEDELIIVVLQNSTGARGPSVLGEALTQLVLGPTPELVGTAFDGDLEALVGTYTGPARGRPLTLEVSRDGTELVFTPRGASNAIRPVHLEGLTWGQGPVRLWFIRNGRTITELHLDQGSGHYVLKRERGG